MSMYAIVYTLGAQDQTQTHTAAPIDFDLIQIHVNVLAIWISRPELRRTHLHESRILTFKHSHNARALAQSKSKPPHIWCMCMGERCERDGCLEVRRWFACVIQEKCVHEVLF